MIARIARLYPGENVFRRVLLACNGKGKLRALSEKLKAK